MRNLDEQELNEVIVDILKDCVADGKAIIKRQQIIITLLIVLTFVLVGYHSYTVTQCQKSGKVMLTQKVEAQRDATVTDGNRVLR